MDFCSNEATLESKATKVLLDILPSININDIEHQRTLVLKIGHNTIELDGKHSKENKGHLKSRLDMLVCYKKEPLMLFEYKKSSHELTEDDKRQALSYGRLLEKIPPLTVLSNGDTTKCFLTYSGESIKSKGHYTLDTLLDYSMKVANDNVEEALKILMGRDDELLRQIIENINRKNIMRLVGSSEDMHNVIAEDFFIEREITRKIMDALLGERIVNIIGPAHSGKTNIIYDICMNYNKEFLPVYIDGYYVEDIYDFIYEELREFFGFESVNRDVRSLLQTYMENEGTPPLLFMIDNIDSGRGGIWKGISKMINLNSNKNFKLLLSMNSYVAKSLTQKSGMMKQVINAPDFEVENLSFREFTRATQIFNKHNLVFGKGYKTNLEYRNIRVMRKIFNFYITNFSRLVKNEKVLIDSLITEKILFNDSLHPEFEEYEDFYFDYGKFIEAIFYQIKNLEKDAQQTMLTMGGGIDIRCIEETSIQSSIERLYEKGYIKRINLRTGKIIYFSENPELLANITKTILIERYSNTECIDCISDLVLLMEYFPYGNLIASSVLKMLFNTNEKRKELYKILFENKPSIKHFNMSSDNKRFLFKATDTEVIEIDTKLLSTIDDDSGVLTANLFPWIILSELLLASSYQSLEINYINRMASFKQPLIRVTNTCGNSLNSEQQLFHEHTIQNISFICGQDGIIEPITLAIYYFSLSNFEKFNNSLNKAIKKKDIAKVNRFSLALNYLGYSSGDDRYYDAKTNAKLFLSKIVDHN